MKHVVVLIVLFIFYYSFIYSCSKELNAFVNASAWKLMSPTSESSVSVSQIQVCQCL